MLELEAPVEERIARLESDVAHTRADISEIRADLRQLNGRVDGVKTLLDANAEAITASLAVQALGAEKSFARVEKSIADLALSTEKSFGELRTERMKDRIWWLLISAGVLTVVAKTFKWF